MCLSGGHSVNHSCCPWIRSIKVCTCSAADAETVSRDFCGRETVFSFSTSVWTAECSVGLGMKRKQGCCPSRRSVGYSRAWSSSSRRQLRNPNREYCIKCCRMKYGYLQTVTEMFAGNLQTFPFFYGIIFL